MADKKEESAKKKGQKIKRRRRNIKVKKTKRGVTVDIK